MLLCIPCVLLLYNLCNVLLFIRTFFQHFGFMVATYKSFGLTDLWNPVFFFQLLCVETFPNSVILYMRIFLEEMSEAISSDDTSMLMDK